MIGVTRYLTEELMHAFVWLGIVLLALWAVLWLGLQIVSGVVHLLVFAAAVLIIWGLLKRGANAIGNRM